MKPLNGLEPMNDTLVFVTQTDSKGRVRYLTRAWVSYDDKVMFNKETEELEWVNTKKEARPLVPCQIMYDIIARMNTKNDGYKYDTEELTELI